MKEILNQIKSQPLESPIVAYKPNSWQEKIELIHTAVLEKKTRIFAVIGESNAGKSTFSQFLYASSQEPIQCCKMSVSPLFSEEELLTQISEQLKSPPMPSLTEFIQQCTTQQQPVLLIIDNAHYLTQTFLQKLITTMHYSSEPSYFHLCLVANPTVLSTIALLDQDIFKNPVEMIQLKDLEETEACEYIRYRLYAQLGELTEMRVKQFYELTDGSIMGINTQLKSFFNLTMASPLQTTKRVKMMVGYSALAFCTLGAIGLAFLMQSHQDFSSLIVHKITVPAIIEKPLLSNIPSMNVAVVRQIMQPALLKKAELQMEDDNDAPVNQVVMDKVLVIPKVIQQKHIPQKVVMTPKHPVHVAVKSNLISSSKGYYTIQVLASKNQADLHRFAQKYQLQKNMSIFQSQKNGQHWYVLTLGSYPKHQSAVNAIKTLPSAITKLNPWIRPFADLKALG